MLLTRRRVRIETERMTLRPPIHADFREWAELRSASADFLLRRGETALEEGEYEQAIDHLTALTDHAPDFAAGWALRARTWFEMDQYGRAIGDLEHVIALYDGEIAWVDSQIGRLLAGLEDLDLGENHLTGKLSVPCFGM